MASYEAQSTKNPFSTHTTTHGIHTTTHGIHMTERRSASRSSNKVSHHVAGVIDRNTSQYAQVRVGFKMLSIDRDTRTNIQRTCDGSSSEASEARGHVMGHLVKPAKPEDMCWVI